MIHFEHPRFDFSDVLSVCAGAFGKRLMFQVFVDLYRLMFHEKYLFPIPPTPPPKTVIHLIYLIFLQT